MMTATEVDIADIYRRYWGMVRRRCLKILGDPEDAEDAAQEVFMRAMRSLSGFRRQASPATWLYRIATNICLNRIRDGKNRERLLRENFVRPEPEAPPEIWPTDILVRVLSEFDKPVRETVMYAVVEEMTHREIAQIMGCSVSLVRKRIMKFTDKAQAKMRRLSGELRVR